MTTLTSLPWEDLVQKSRLVLEAGRRQQQEAIETRRREWLQRAENEARAWLGDDWVFLLDQGEAYAEWWTDNRLKGLTWHIIFPPEAQLAPIVIHWDKYRYDGSHIRAWIGDENVQFRRVTEPGHLLAKAREAWPEWREHLLETWEKKLRARHANTLEGLAAIRQKIETAWNEVPEHLKPDLQSVLRESLQSLDEWAARLHQRQQERQQAEARREQYLNDLRDFVRQQVAPVFQALRQKKEEIEGRKFTLYRVTYALVARDEIDEEAFLETHEFYAWRAQPDEEGWWGTTNGRRLRISHLVSVEEIHITPAEAPWSVSLPEAHWMFRVSGVTRSLSIRFPPGAEDEARALQEQYRLPVLPAHLMHPPVPDWEIEEVLDIL